METPKEKVIQLINKELEENYELINDEKNYYHDDIQAVKIQTNFLAKMLLEVEEIPDKPNRNTGSFLKPDQKEHADKVFEFLTTKTVAKDCECDKLQADKEELLEALETVLHNSDVPNEIYDQSKTLIQKHKQ